MKFHYIPPLLMKPFALLLISTFFFPAFGAEKEIFTPEPAWQSVTLTGFTRPLARIELAGETSGRCLEVFADVGEAIPTDGVFACLDKTFIDLEIQSNQVEQQRLQREISYYRKEIERLQKLLQTSAAAQAELDRIQWNRDNSQYLLAARKVEAKRLAQQKARFCIRARPGLRVIERAIEVGEWVNAGQPVAVLGDFSSLAVPLAVNMEEWNALRALPELDLELPELERTVKAGILRMSPDFDVQTRKFPLELAVTEAVTPMRGGLRAQLALRLPHPDGAVVVPDGAVREHYEEFMLVRTDGERVPVMVLGQGPQAGTVLVSGAGLAEDEFVREPSH